VRPPTEGGLLFSIEYGLIAAGIAVAIIAAVNGLGSQVKATFGSVSTAMKQDGPLIRSRLRKAGRVSGLLLMEVKRLSEVLVGGH
jgi:pilus assembly protein Flp/PilA